MDRLTLYGSFTSSSSYKPMLYLALARLPFSFRTVNLKTGVQRTPEYLALNRWGVVPSLRHRGELCKRLGDEVIRRRGEPSIQ
jgi:glutathione S-transferase